MQGMHLTGLSCSLQNLPVAFLAEKRSNILKGQSSEILIHFFLYMDGPMHEYKTLRALKFFKGSKDFRSEMAFFGAC
jgi:hypothetical protein